MVNSGNCAPEWMRYHTKKNKEQESVRSDQEEVRMPCQGIATINPKGMVSHRKNLEIK